jgi:hypothetical protein
MVATTKRCLQKVLGRSQVDVEELQSILVRIEAPLNSRSIIQNVNETMTLAEFLTGGKLTNHLPRSEPVQTEDLTKTFR